MDREGGGGGAGHPHGVGAEQSGLDQECETCTRPLLLEHMLAAPVMANGFSQPALVLHRA